MKYVIIILASLIPKLILSQITIDEQDLPERNDSLRYSVASNYFQFDFSTTDTNYIWDFSNLIASGQELDFYQSPSNAPVSYQLTFNAFNTDMTKTSEDMNLLGTSLKEIYYYYNKGNNKFSEIGVAAKVDGIPITVNYDSDDLIYTFPMQMNDTSASYSSWNFDVPNYIYVGRTKIRSNIVDGWGEIITPLGRYDCLRLKSTVTQIDTLSYDSIPFPLPAITTVYNEYIWITKLHKLPVLYAKIDQMQLDVKVKFADNIKSFTNIIKTHDNNMFSVYPNPVAAVLYIKPENLSNNYEVRIYNTNYQLIKNCNNCNIIKTDELAKGFYIIEIISEKGK